MTLEHGDTLNTESCTYDGGLLRVQPNDPMVPDHIEIVACVDCGRMYEYDTVTGKMEADE